MYNHNTALTGGNGPGGTSEVIVDGASYYFDLTVSYSGSPTTGYVIGSVGVELLEAW